MNDAVARLADLDPLPPPELWQETVVAVIVLVSLVTVGIAWRLRRPPAPPAVEREGPADRLEALTRLWRDGEIAPRRLAYELAALLRHRYRSRALSARRRPPRCPLDEEEWRDLIERLDTARYSSPSAPPPAFEACLRLVGRCLADDVAGHA